ncbi:MAG: hypothetical protein JO217_07075 [Acidobacteriaceae bacterium]|nr:hypothetical protein [Acidobacteriaceae bacterium]MBV9442441.1 hypothetical protein [Acidobacteriaceae bacterium]
MNSLSSPLINLATQPFRRERAQNAVIALACAALSLSLLFLVSLILRERVQAADLRRSIDIETAALRNVALEQARYTGVLRRPENADVFSVSVFLNELIARRAVSWNRVFKDLGTVMPNNMRLISVRLPQLPSEDTTGVDHLQLDMVLGTDKPETIVTLLKQLESSKLFGAAQLLAETPPSQNDPLYKFRVTVAYDQKL